MSGLPATTRAAVMTGKRRMEVRELPVPVVNPADGLLLVEAAGVCGADVGFYNQELSPRVLGHENVGIVAAAGRVAADRWGVKEGDRVAIEEYLPCGHCDFCRSGEYRSCLESDASANPDALRFGSTPLTTPPALWGGYSQYLYLHPRSVLHPLPASIPAVQGSLALPIGNGYQWTYLDAGVGPGDTVLIFGPGQQGLACVVAAREAGAGQIIIVGLERDAARLAVAAKLGAHHTLVAGEQLPERVRAIVGPAGVDVTIDTAAGNEQTVAHALDLTRKRGRLVFPASTRRPLAGVDFFKITRKHLTVKGARGHSYAAVEWAIALIGSRRYPLELMCTLECGLDDADRAVRGTGGELDVPVIHAAVVPAPN
ncbi:zinc-binding dehydrogenase [Rugosimonospora acidiphila]|uniref:Zinc-binding dehydrogenase n=1 Tax=Rugosimonospora acidiphila TaxID=556531 RepID=A0ABP9SRA4_9ACTN